jgi:hypothetical protein
MLIVERWMRLTTESNRLWNEKYVFQNDPVRSVFSHYKIEKKEINKNCNYGTTGSDKTMDYSLKGQYA